MTAMTTSNGAREVVAVEPVETPVVALARTAPVTSFARGLEPNTFEAAYQMAGCIAQTGMCGVKSAEDALVRLMTGRELGLSAMQSLRAVYVVNGRPGLDASVMQALAERHPECEVFTFEESTAERATLRVKRKGKPEQRITWTLNDAKAAGLVKAGGNWASYPTQMLRARCKADAARLEFPDALFGISSIEELRDIGDVMPEAPQTIDVDARVVDEARVRNEALKASLISRIESVNGDADRTALRKDIDDARKSGNLAKPYIDDVIAAYTARFPKPAGKAPTPAAPTREPGDEG